VNYPEPQDSSPQSHNLFLNDPFTITLPFMRMFLKWHFLSGFSKQNFVSISRFLRPIRDLSTLITRDEYELYRSSLGDFILLPVTSGDRGSTVVKVLCYKSGCRWFDPSWCQWIFHYRTMALGSTQSPREMSTRSISWGVKAAKADNLPPSCAVVSKSRNLNFLEPSGPVQACNGTALLPYSMVQSPS